jgi:5,10-methylenetetrahydromethanopterin reductase
MNDLKFDLGFSSRTVAGYPLSRRIAIVKSAEALGFDRLWHSNEKFGRDMVANMTLSATQTERIGIGAAVADPYSVHPALTATAMATVDEISCGRVLVGLGAGGSGFPAMGIERVKPVAAIREAVSIMRAMWSGKPAVVKGQVVRVEGGVLGFRARPDIPVVIATRGPSVFRLAGEIADGVMIATMATPEGVRTARAFIDEGIRKAGRKPDEVEIISRVDTCVDPDRDKARAGVKQMIAFLLWSSYPNRDFVSQAGLEVPAELEAMIAKRDYELMFGAGPLIPEAFVDAFAWAGTPEEVAAKIGAIADVGIRRFGTWVLPPSGGDVETVIELIAGRVMPAVCS